MSGRAVALNGLVCGQAIESRRLRLTNKPTVGRQGDVGVNLSYDSPHSTISSETVQGPLRVAVCRIQR